MGLFKGFKKQDSKPYRNIKTEMIELFFVAALLLKRAHHKKYQQQKTTNMLITILEKQ